MTSSGTARNGAPPADRRPDTKTETPVAHPSDQSLPVGPHPGVVSVPAQYVFEQNIRQMQTAVGSDPTREDNYRLQGVQAIDNVRQALHLPVRTFDTAAVYFHRFRLRHREAEYNLQDSAMAALFVACKVEDTIKKSKDILCAAYNLKNPDHQTTPDDKIFEQPSRVLVGLERMILEIIGFDFRTRYPQKYLVKLIRELLGPAAGRPFFEIAYEMSIDMYKTFVPIKQTCLTMVLAIVHLTALITDTHTDLLADLDPARYSVTRRSLMETILDLLELYTHFHKLTKVGARFDLNRFIDVKIKINDQIDASPDLSRLEFSCESCAERDMAESRAATSSSGPVTSLGITSVFNPVKPGSRGSDTTVRFVFDREQAQEEARAVGVYFNEEYEEYEAEIEEPIPEPERFQDPRDRGHGPGPGPGHPPGGRGRRGGRGGGRHDGWGPYPRNPRGHGPHDRRGGGGGGGRRYH
ncbi:related to CTK2 Carboxy-terminal domain (CTD) kinase, beta subunit [Cephalotrichum gorgonifer]|uniref:RNA polymerase II holoenzyme cyclin-like subunit n=1 Tax=Cephalotrichum gorgonifer TaxID=2041049 RepID=A0AAE8SSB8_9PEZI|nr:related to CTK2 Carboxy-terminal domain (CTD) kinase, beta subunit [Cephalotrichum gorgonifer]